MLKALKSHWPEYLMEAALLGVFMTFASIFALLLEYPGSLAHQAIGNESLRHVLLGLGMGCVIAGIVYSPWGKQSGAHINPAVTLSFWRLGKIKGWDVCFYILAQFAGGLCAVLLMRLLVGQPYTDPKILYVVTKPGPAGAGIAFAAEGIISFVLMFVVLASINSKKLEKLTGLFSGLLIALYLSVEVNLSGMSLNPARSSASAIVALHWGALWVYFAAPVLAMLAATEVYTRFQKKQSTACPKLHHANDRRCIFCDKAIPTYPVEQPA